MKTFQTIALLNLNKFISVELNFKAGSLYIFIPGFSDIYVIRDIINPQKSKKEHKTDGKQAKHSC